MRKLAVSLAVFAMVGVFGTGTSGAQTANDPTVTIGSNCGGALFCYQPSSVTVMDGGTISWTNTSGVQHTVTRCTTAVCGGMGPGTGTDASFANGTIGAAMNATFSHTFHGAGTYNYYCTIHGFGVMHGVVTVLAATPSTTSPPSATAPPPTAVAPQGNAATPPTAPTMSTSPSGSGVAAAQTGSNLPHTGTNTGAALAAAILCLGIGTFVLLATRRRRLEH